MFLSEGTIRSSITNSFGTNIPTLDTIHQKYGQNPKRTFDAMNYMSAPKQEITGTDVTIGIQVSSQQTQIDENDNTAHGLPLMRDLIFMMNNSIYPSKYAPSKDEHVYLDPFSLSWFILNQAIKYNKQREGKSLTEQMNMDVNASKFCKYFIQGEYLIGGKTKDGKPIPNYEEMYYHLFLCPQTIVRLFRFFGVLYSQNMSNTLREDYSKRQRPDVSAMETSILKMREFLTKIPIQTKYDGKEARPETYVTQNHYLTQYVSGGIDIATNTWTGSPVIHYECVERPFRKITENGYEMDRRPGQICGRIGVVRGFMGVNDIDLDKYMGNYNLKNVSQENIEVEYKKYRDVEKLFPLDIDVV